MCVRESTEVSFNSEQGGVELDPMVEDGDDGRDGTVPVRLVVVVVEEEGEGLLLLQVAREEEGSEEDRR